MNTSTSASTGSAQRLSASANHAWQSVLGQLQMEMPRASFDTWVRDTKAVSLEDGALIVGVRNAYAKDWLESRLESTVNRLLVGILGAGNVQVQFVVAGENDFENDQAELESPTAIGAAEENEGGETVEVTLTDYDSVYEMVVRPNRAVYLKGYFRRWLRYLGPDLGWLYVAFRQSAYIAGSRSGKALNRISGKRIASLAGCTERTYWNRVEKSETWQKLKGLVEISDYGPQWDNAASTPKRLPRRYAIAMTLPMTPADSHSLSRWISANIERFGGSEGVLRAASEAPLDELIPLDATEESDSLTVTQLVRQLFDGGELPNAQLDALASAIQNHIMPEGDVIVITEYFLRHVLPHIGAGQSWMLTLLRDMCFVDNETGESRNHVTVRGGYAEIAGWLGMSRPKTVWEWMNEKYPEKHTEGGKYKHPIVRVFMHEVEKDDSVLDFEGQSRSFDVLLEEIPREFLEIAVTKPNGAIFSIAMARFSEAVGALFSIGMARFSYPDGAIFSIGLARFSESIGATFRVLSSLTLKTNSLNSLNTTSFSTNAKRSANDEETVEDQGAVKAPSAWVLDRILIQNKVHPKTQKVVRGASAKALVSWLLYALSPDGHGIDKPMSYALARLKDDPQSGAGEGYDDLAEFPPAVLIDIAHKVSRGHLMLGLHTQNLNRTARLWLDVMGKNDYSARKLLRFLLGNQSPDIREKITRVESKGWTEEGFGITIEESIEEI